MSDHPNHHRINYTYSVDRLRLFHNASWMDATDYIGTLQPS